MDIEAEVHRLHQQLGKLDLRLVYQTMEKGEILEELNRFERELCILKEQIKRNAE